MVVLDEAGAVGLDDMAKVFELARLKDCRVILSGDTGQHASVTRGDALRILEQYSNYRFSELTTIRRQKPEAFREIVELAAAKQTDKAFAKLLELGAVTESCVDRMTASFINAPPMPTCRPQSRASRRCWSRLRGRRLRPSPTRCARP